VLKLINFQPVGAGQHRSGWPYCLNAIRRLVDGQASSIVLDDFVERTFFYDNVRLQQFSHRRPWVGIMHHPPDMPNWYMPELHLQQLHISDRWQRSVKNLRLLLTMGDNLTSWCKQQWPDIPCETLRHPTGLPQFYWSPEKFLGHAKKPVLQVGWFLRNMVALQQAQLSDSFEKIQLVQKSEWVPRVTAACETFYDQYHPERRYHGMVRKIAAVSDVEYDEWLAESVVLIEVISAVANNTVVECIIRNTPICVNRHPGPEYYLGKAYPLFYEHFSDIPDVLTIDNVLAAHHYLRTLDKWWIHGDAFCEHLQAACRQHLPEWQDSRNGLTFGQEDGK